MGWDHELIVAVKLTLDDSTTVATYGQQSGSPEIVCEGLHQCDTALGSTFMGSPYCARPISSRIAQANGPGLALDFAP